MLARLTRAAWSGAAAVMSTPAMRPVVKVLSNLHVALYRRTGGRAQAPRHPTMLLTVTGRRTGRARTVPLVYATDGDDLIVAAAYAGSSHHPQWWLNLQQNPHAQAEVSSRRLPVRAELAARADRDRLWAALVAVYPPFVGYQQRTTRQIPIIRLVPTAAAPNP